MTKTDYSDFIVMLKSNDYHLVDKYLLDNSKLPGPSANLSLSYTFADYYENNEYDYFYLTSVTEFKDDNNPNIFISFCKLLSLGSIYHKVSIAEKDNIINLLNFYAIQDSWRLKEACAMAYQRIGKRDVDVLLSVFKKLYQCDNMLSQRLVLASLADYPLLSNKELSIFSLEVAESLLNSVMLLEPAIYKTSSYKVLKKGLDYSLSVFIYVEPSGFQILEKYAQKDNKQIKSIIKSNLKKTRLTKHYPKQVALINKLLK